MYNKLIDRTQLKRLCYTQMGNKIIIQMKYIFFPYKIIYITL